MSKSIKIALAAICLNGSIKIENEVQNPSNYEVVFGFNTAQASLEEEYFDGDEDPSKKQDCYREADTFHNQCVLAVATGAGLATGVAMTCGPLAPACAAVVAVGTAINMYNCSEFISISRYKCGQL